VGNELKISIRIGKIHKKQIKIIPLDFIAFVKQGLATGNNKEYFYKKENENGSYRKIGSECKKLITLKDIKQIQNDGNLRKIIIENGISKKQFDGRFIVPIEKGGSSDIESGKLSNYYAPTGFFIDWSKGSVKKLKTLTIADWKRYYGKKNIPKDDENKRAAVLRNVELYFKQGITFSPTGLYAPTYRLNSGAIFDHAGDCIFLKKEFRKLFSEEYLLGILCSKFMRYVQKSFINNSVSMQVDDVKKNPVPISDKKTKNKLEELVYSIIKKQKNDPGYDYQNHEQVEIDDLVYEVFGLDQELIGEVETWYARRYPKLIRKTSLEP